MLDHLGLDALIPIGGDDTLSFALRLTDEGVPVVAIPKTMDNDVHGTDYCIGFSTAITRTVIFIHQLRTSAGSHERLAIVEVFGRYSGETSLVSAYLSGVDRAIISEVPFDIEKLAGLLTADKRANPSSYAMMTISEGATMVGGEMVQGGREDAYGHRKLGGVGQLTSELLHEVTGDGVIYQQIGYLMRSGSPDSLDLMVAINYAVMAADLVIEGTTGRLVALRNGNYVNVPLDVTRQGVKRVDVASLYDSDSYQTEDPSRRRQTDVPILTRPWLPTGSTSVRTPSPLPPLPCAGPWPMPRSATTGSATTPPSTGCRIARPRSPGKEAALYVPTGTMANQIGVRLHVHGSGHLVAATTGAHVASTELMTSAVLSGITFRTGDPGPRAWMTADLARELVEAEDPYDVEVVDLIAVENTVGHAGGTVMPVEELRAIRKVADDNGLPIHLDGARIFNAAVAAGVDVTEYTREADTMMFCVSKGLGAPIGSLVCGTREHIREARRLKILFGGAWRQAGIMAAAGLIALEDGPKRLHLDHERARRLAEGVAEILPGSIDPGDG